jgi:hypothetical protein
VLFSIGSYCTSSNFITDSTARNCTLADESILFSDFASHSLKTQGKMYSVLSPFLAQPTLHPPSISQTIVCINLETTLYSLSRLVVVDFIIPAAKVSPTSCRINLAFPAIELTRESRNELATSYTGIM